MYLVECSVSPALANVLVKAKTSTAGCIFLEIRPETIEEFHVVFDAAGFARTLGTVGGFVLLRRVRCERGQAFYSTIGSGSLIWIMERPEVRAKWARLYRNRTRA